MLVRAPEAELEGLLSEGPDAARQRELTAFDKVAGPYANRIVLFGAGGLGRRTLSGLRKQGVEPICFADNNRELWDREVLGLPVISPAEAARTFGSNSVFVITIWGGKKSWSEEDRMGDRVGELRALGCERVTTFGTLYWKYATTLLPYYSADLPHKVQEAASEVRAAFDLWADQQSREEYVDQIRWRLCLDFEGLSNAVPQTMYFPGDLFELTPEEAFVDCGAYDGDTLEVFLKESGGHFRKYWALEPDPINFRKLQANCAALLASDTRISTFQLASGAREGRLSFVADGSDAARVASAGAQDSVEVDAVSLDTFLEGQQVTFLKMDIEGSEIDALEGAARVIRDDAPVLGICAYHRQDDIWKIPLLIKRLNPHYDFFLRPHKQEVWDLVCYAIPSKRLKNA